MKKLNILLALIFNVILCYGQVEPNSGTHRMQASSQTHDLQNKLDKSKSSLTDLISIDKSGDVSFSIPLLNINGRRLSIPITANYKTGIKVDQKSSEIGLGWSINFGSVTRDYGAFEPDYAETSIEARMINVDSPNFSSLSNPGAVANLDLNNKDLTYEHVNVSPGGDYNKMTPDNFQVTIPGKGTDAFWNKGQPNTPHDFAWSNSSPWQIDHKTKTYIIDQEYSRINELNYQFNSGLNQLDDAGNIAAAICIPPYVHDRYFKKNTNGSPMSSGSLYNSEVRYRDFESFTITGEDGTRYVYGRALRGQKYLFTEDPFWSTMPDVGNTPPEAVYGEFWKIDFIAEWLLTEITSFDYIDSNNNGIPDKGDKGDWIVIQYTDPHQVETIPGSNVSSIVVPKHREWLNFTQTDKYSSLMRERAYVKKISTPIQEIDFQISRKFDVDHDYFKIPLNNPDNNHPYVYQSVNAPGGGSNSDLHIYYPIELMKYDKIEVFENLKDENYARNNLLKRIEFEYAEQGSNEQLAVSNYLIRNNSDSEIVPYNPSVIGPEYDDDGIFIGGFDVENYNFSVGRGKLTLLGIKTYNGSDISNSDPKSYKFEYANNPKLDYIKKNQILKLNSFPTLRKSGKAIRESNAQRNVKTSLLPYKTKEIGVKKWGNNWQEYNFEVETCISENLDDQIGKTVLGYYFDSSLPNNARDAWSLTSITIPMGGRINLEYENDDFNYNHDLNIDSDRKEWNNIGSILDNELPYISFYNTTARQKSLHQAYLNAINETSTKKLYRSYSMPLASNNGGIRLKNKIIEDGINDPIQVNYEYGLGHFTSVPKAYWKNFITGFSSFIQSETVRQESPAAYYNLISEFNEYNNSLIYLSNNMRVDNSVNAVHYYEYIDEILIDTEITDSYPFLRSHYGGASSRDKTYQKQIDVTIKGIDRKEDPVVELLTQNQESIDQIKLLKSEKFESSSIDPYFTKEIYYNQFENHSRINNFSEFTLESVAHDLYAPYSASNGLVKVDPHHFSFISIIPFEGPHSWSHIFEGSCESTMDLEIAEDINYFADNVVGQSWTTFNDDGFTTSFQSIKRYQSAKSQVEKILTSYLDLTNEINYTYEQEHGLIKEIEKDNSKKNINGDLTENKLITEYKYVFEDPQIGNLFEEKNILTNKYEILDKLESNWTVNPLSNVVRSTIQSWDINSLHPKGVFEYNSEILASGPAAGVVTDFIPFDISSNSNSLLWEERRVVLGHNQYGQPLSSKQNNLYNRIIYGYNSSIPKAIFSQTGQDLDATYTGFEDTNKDDGSFSFWDANEEEFWYDLNIDRNYSPTESMVNVNVYKNQNPICVISNSGPPCSSNPIPCTNFGNSGFEYNFGDYRVSINNYAGQWAVGDHIRLSKNLDPEVNINLNNTSFEQVNLPEFETTISNIIFEPSNSIIQTQFGFPQTLVDYTDWDQFDYYICFSDPIPQEYNGHFGVYIEKINDQVINSFPTQNQSHSGEYSFQLGNRLNLTNPTQKTPVRPIKIAGLGANYSPYVASVWLKKQNNSIPAGDIRFNYIVWNNDRTAILDGGTTTIVGLNADWKYYEIPIIRTTSFSGILEVYIENDWTVPQNSNTLYVDDLLIYPENVKYEYYSYDKYLNVISATDNNDNYINSSYDDWGRISKLYDYKGQLISENNYFNTSNITMNHNFEEATTWIDDNTLNITRIFMDGFGKVKQTSTLEPSKNRRYVQTLDYDQLGRLKREYNSLGEYGINHGIKASNDYEVKLNNLYGTGSSPFIEYGYLSRPDVFNSEINHQFQLGVVPNALLQSEESINSNSEVTYSFINYPEGQLLKNKTIDENGNISENYIDKGGNLISIKSRIGQDYDFSFNGVISFNPASSVEYAETYFTYDGANNNIAVLDPEGIITNKSYNSLGQIISHTHPDKGTTEYRYNRNGQIRFVKDGNDFDVIANNNLIESFTYYKYDDWNRLIEVGKYLLDTGSPVWNSIDLLNDPTFPDENNLGVQLHKKWVYDGPKSKNALGRLWKEIVYSTHQLVGQQFIADEVDTYIYEYDKNGNIILKEFDLDGLTNIHALHYSYNRQNIPNQIEYRNQGNSSVNFIEVLTYDDLGRLSKTTSGSDLNNITSDSEYNYDALGNLKSYTLAENSIDKETVSLQYDIRNRLISQVSENFRFKLEYDKKSNIVGQTWSNSYFDISTSPFQQNKYEYFYDNYDRLIGANYSQLNSDNNPFQNYQNIINSSTPEFNCIYIYPNISEIDIGVLIKKYNIELGDEEAFSLFNTAFKTIKNNNIKPEEFGEKMLVLESQIREEERFSNDLHHLLSKSTIEDTKFIIESRKLVLKQEMNEDRKSLKSKVLKTLEYQNLSNTEKKKEIVRISKEFNEDIKKTKALIDNFNVQFGILHCTLNPNATSLHNLCEPLLNPNLTLTNIFDTQYRYTKSGNINNLKRNDDQGIDKDLNYSYTEIPTPSNKLEKVEHWSAGILDFNQTFEYDSNGNVTGDDHNSYSHDILVNPFNMITQVEDNSTSISSYRYDINNNRIHKAFSNSADEYNIGHVIVNQSGSPIQYGIINGYVDPSNFSKEYSITDWLGTPRVNIQDNIQVSHTRDHYPFGLLMPNRHLSNNIIGERLQFTGHENDTETTYDYHGARYYNHDLCRYLGVDPLVNDPLNIGTSSYTYVWNNPLKFIDPDGRLGESTHVNELGQVIAEYDDGDDGVYVHSNGTTAEDISCNYSCENTGAGGQNIGSLGGNIDIGSTGMYSLKMANSANQVLAKGFTFGDWYTNVKGGGVWDLKANKETIWGVAWSYDTKNKTSTSFSTANLLFENASDFGNYHAGFTGSMFGIYIPVQKIGAGVVEQLKDLRNGNLNQVGEQYIEMFRFEGRNAFMDEADDHYWNTQGMSDARYLKKKLNLSSSKLLNVQKR